MLARMTGELSLVSSSSTARCGRPAPTPTWPSTSPTLPDHLLRAVPLDASLDVLDVATGTGNVALPAAARLAPDVTGLDLVPSLLDIARRAAGAVDVHWVEGDAEALPFGDATFDRVLSVFGVQFAPHHEIVAGELLRLCRPGGTIGLVNWTPEGLIGRLFKILGAYSPPPPEGASPPPKWGSEDHVRPLFAGCRRLLRARHEPVLVPDTSTST